MAIFSLIWSYRSTKDDVQKDACLICLCFYWDPWWMWHPWTVKQDRQHGVCIYIYIGIYNMYCTHFTVNTSEVHSHISITCSNSMRILLGWGQVAEAFKLCRELRDNQQESYTPASQVKAAVCCSRTAWRVSSWAWNRLNKPWALRRDSSGIAHDCCRALVSPNSSAEDLIFFILAVSKRDSLLAAQRVKLQMKKKYFIPQIQNFITKAGA